MTKRQIFYLSLGTLLVGLFLLAWGALSGSMGMAIVGMLLFFGAGFVRLWWWIKAARS